MARETHSHCTDGRGRVTAGLPLFVIGADGDGVADLEQLVSGRAGGAGLFHPRLTVTDLTQRRLPAQRAGVAGHPAGSGAAQSAARRPSDPQDSSAVITETAEVTRTSPRRHVRHGLRPAQLGTYSGLRMLD